MQRTYVQSCYDVTPATLMPYHRQYSAVDPASQYYHGLNDDFACTTSHLPAHSIHMEYKKNQTNSAKGGIAPHLYSLGASIVIAWL